MRKHDYETLARELRKRTTAPARADWCGEYWQQNAARLLADAEAARSLARYLAEHLSVDRSAFLAACGVRE